MRKILIPIGNYKNQTYTDWIEMVEIGSLKSFIDVFVLFLLRIDLKKSCLGTVISSYIMHSLLGHYFTFICMKMEICIVKSTVEIGSI